MKYFITLISCLFLAGTAMANGNGPPDEAPPWSGTGTQEQTVNVGSSSDSASTSSSDSVAEVPAGARAARSQGCLQAAARIS